MRTPIRSLRALLAAFAALGAFSSLSIAQSVTTAPVGAVTKSVVVGLNSVGITLLNPDLVVANASANTSSAITLAGVSDVGSLLTPGTPYYVEAVSGPLEGERFDVDTAATILAANGSVSLLASSTNNTFVLAPDNAIDSQFALRKHVTLSQVQSFFTTPLVGNNSSGSADQIWIYDSVAGAFNFYFLRTDGLTWRAIGSQDSANNVVIAPGVGIFVRKVSSSASLVATGGVRTNDFSMPMPAGLSFRSPAYPISYSPQNLGGTSAFGWTGNNSSGSADQLQNYDTASGAFITYFLRSDGVTWRLLGTQDAVTTSPVLTFDSGYFVVRQSADTNYVLNSPISL